MTGSIPYSRTTCIYRCMIAPKTYELYSMSPRTHDERKNILRDSPSIKSCLHAAVGVSTRAVSRLEEAESSLNCNTVKWGIGLLLWQKNTMWQNANPLNCQSRS
jgi:hypothetical protein